MKKESLLIFSLALLLTMASCNEDETPFDATTDVLTWTRYDSEGNLEYGNAYYVFANKSMADVSVKTTDNKTITLAPNAGSKATFYKEADDKDYSKTPPSIGTYSFDILTSNNEEVKMTDQLESSFAAPVNITKANIKDDVLDLEWDDAAKAQAYFFNIKKISDDTETQLFFTRSLLQETSYSINTFDLSPQLKTPSEGEEYIIEVRAYKFESNVEVNLTSNIQSVSFAKATITWE
jgi:hypothetical protein